MVELLEWIPIELRPMSVFSLILFSFGGIAVVYLHSRMNNIDHMVINRSLDIKRLMEMCANNERLVESIKIDNRKMVGWIREDNQRTTDRIEKSISEIRSQIYEGK